MEPLYQLVTALLSAHAPWWLLAIAVVAIAARHVGPIRLNLSIGDCTSQPVPQDPRVIAGAAPDRTFADNTAAAQLRNNVRRLRDHGCK